MPAFAPSASLQRLSQRQPHVLHRVVVVNMNIPPGGNREITPPVPRDMGKHVVKETDAGRNIRDARTVEIEREPDLSL